LNPTHTSKYNGSGLALGKHLLEKDSDGKPNLISILKHKRKRTDQINDDIEEILEAAGISNSHEFKGQNKISRKV
jgi:hypothetical protein